MVVPLLVAHGRPAVRQPDAVRRMGAICHTTPTTIPILLQSNLNPLLQWLAAHPGGAFFSSDVDAARNAAHSALMDALNSLPTTPPPFQCHAAATLRDDLLLRDAAYRLKAYELSDLAATGS
jgi:hypothetical protein